MSVFLQPIYTQTVGAGGASSVKFNNIPQNFTDLKVEISGRGASNPNSIQADVLVMYINNNVSNIYGATQLYGNGSGVYSNRISSQPNTFNGTAPTSGATANTFGNTEIYISNYSGSNSKQIIYDSISESNVGLITNQGQTLGAISFQSSAGISVLEFYTTGGNWAQYSTFSLYGVLRQGI
jgi:hypothetical protein